MIFFSCLSYISIKNNKEKNRRSTVLLGPVEKGKKNKLRRELAMASDGI